MATREDENNVGKTFCDDTEQSSDKAVVLIETNLFRISHCFFVPSICHLIDHF